MTLRALSLALLLSTAFGCSAGEAIPADDRDPGDEGVASSALSAVEDVKQYESCKDSGHANGPVHLARLNADLGPATRAIFNTAECIVGRMPKFKGTFRPYNLQSFKNTAAGKTFFFKRVSENRIGEAPSECLKVKMSATVGATDVFVTISRVKQLPAAPVGVLCSDNGET